MYDSAGTTFIWRYSIRTIRLRVVEEDEGEAKGFRHYSIQGGVERRER